MSILIVSTELSLPNWSKPHSFPKLYIYFYFWQLCEWELVYEANHCLYHGGNVKDLISRWQERHPAVAEPCWVLKSCLKILAAYFHPIGIHNTFFNFNEDGCFLNFENAPCMIIFKNLIQTFEGRKIQLLLLPKTCIVTPYRML